jgi:peptidyl-Lys metalloendopeptidase
VIGIPFMLRREEMRSILLGALLFMSGVSTSALAAPGGVRVVLDPPARSTDAGSGTMAFTVTNESASPLHLLRWQTPLDGVESDLFDVTANGDPVDYAGRLVKRPAPQSTDYIELKAGESRTVEVDLSAYYDMRKGGQYIVEYRRDAATLVREADRAARADVAATLSLESRPVTLWVDGAPAPLDEEVLQSSAGNPGVLAATNSFVSCSNTRQTQLATARTSSVTYANNAKSYLTAGTAGSRYTWWFGTYTSSRYSTVRTHFTNIASALSSQPYTFNCSCNDSSYAYVYPTQPYKVYLCGAFWSAPNTGTDSRAGTLIHETSHFNVVASTDDWAYGQTNAHSLAGSNPAHAIDNADSHEYFSENNPARN